jgi:sulfatase modifying factor 1
MKTTIAASLVIASSIFSSIASASVTIDWVTVGNAGNAADPLTGYGAVGYEYKIGKYEVTNAQYGAFLNAKGQSNSNGIYNSSMSSYGITQSGSSGSYTYSVTGTLANRPVVYVSWFDAARFANWMMNGQGSSDTETGAYTLNGATSGVFNSISGGFFLKNAGAQVYIPTENEWYKAAYYNGETSSYSLHPNGKNTISTSDANYGLINATSGSTDIGTYSSAPSSYGTFDQGGNVMEWNDALVFTTTNSRGLRGGSYSTDENFMLGTTRSFIYPAAEEYSFGFRLASITESTTPPPSIPEPSAPMLTMLAGGVMLIRRKR